MLKVSHIDAFIIWLYGW